MNTMMVMFRSKCMQVNLHVIMLLMYMNMNVCMYIVFVFVNEYVFVNAGTH